MSDHASQLGAVAKRLEEAAGRLKAQHAPAPASAASRPASASATGPRPGPDAAQPHGSAADHPSDDLTGPLARLRAAGDDLHRARARLAEIEARVRAG